ncbi:MAG: class I SAM-dependent methyltransferase [Candidatus Wildermuthbacteria bacterium]|nr:class I SAM-dependent methyltransferase [Candidatus Wildermuthbacteria bacterium]
MISLPDFNKAFDYENDFYLSCDSSRMAKMAAHYELYKLSSGIAGDIAECGVFKGVALVRFAMFQKLFGEMPKKVIGFDTFGMFPETSFEGDKGPRQKFIDDAGAESITVEQLQTALQHKGLGQDAELVAGDITKTVPEYAALHPDMKFSLINLDVDIYEPSVTVLQYLYPKLEKGGVLILDDYGRFPGETKAVDDYFQGQGVEIHQFPFCKTPQYIIKT